MLILDSTLVPVLPDSTVLTDLTRAIGRQMNVTSDSDSYYDIPTQMVDEMDKGAESSGMEDLGGDDSSREELPTDGEDYYR